MKHKNYSESIKYKHGCFHKNKPHISWNIWPFLRLLSTDTFPLRLTNSNGLQTGKWLLLHPPHFLKFLSSCHDIFTPTFDTRLIIALSGHWIRTIDCWVSWSKRRKWKRKYVRVWMFLCTEMKFVFFLSNFRFLHVDCLLS